MRGRMKPEPRCKRCGGETLLLTQPCPKCQKRDNAEAGAGWDRDCGQPGYADLRMGVIWCRDNGLSPDRVREIVEGELWAYEHYGKAKAA